MSRETTIRTLCAARLDPNVAPATFVELIETLVAEVHDAAVAETLEHAKAGNGRDPDDPEPTPVGPRQAPSSPRRHSSGRGRGAPGKLGYDDKVRMRQRYDEAVEEAQAKGYSRAPRGFLEELAGEFNCSLSTVKNVVYRKDGT